MSRASGCLWLAVGLILALAAGGVAFVALQRATVTRSQVGPATTKPIVVAARPIEAGTTLGDADMTVQNFPAETAPVGAVTSLAEAKGKITTIPLNTGEMILAHHLTQPDITAGNLGFTLPPGKVAVTLAAEDLLSQAQLVQVGAKVNILYSLQFTMKNLNEQGGAAGGGEEKVQYTFGALQNATIVGIVRGAGAGKDKAQPLTGGQTGGSPIGADSSYVLALEPQDALVLKYLRDAGAVMDLALRNATDEIDHEMRAVDLLYLIDKYQLFAR
jgi:Flp pilus assembly protein CpaB